MRARTAVAAGAPMTTLGQRFVETPATLRARREGYHQGRVAALRESEPERARLNGLRLALVLLLAGHSYTSIAGQHQDGELLRAVGSRLLMPMTRIGPRRLDQLRALATQGQPAELRPAELAEFVRLYDAATSA